MPRTPSPPPPSIEDIVEHELPDLPRRLERGGHPWLLHPGTDLVGLALSGGGIRSATFNLGLLEGLDEIGLLSRLDYLSTVSGGGYIGAFWTAWRARAPAARRRDTCIFPSPSADGTEPPELRHLREFSNFLTPRLGLLSYDTGRMLVAAITAVIPSLLAALSLIILVLLGWLALAHLIVPGPPGSLALSGSAALRSTLALSGLTILDLALFEWAWRTRGEVPTSRLQLPVAALAIAATAAVWLALVAPGGLLARLPPRPTPLTPGPSLHHPVALLTPALAWGSGVLALVLLRWVTARFTRPTAPHPFETACDRVASRLLFLAASWSTIAALWLASTSLAAGFEPRDLATAMAGGTTAGGTVFALVQRILARAPKGPPRATFATRLRPILPRLIAYVTMALGIMATMLVLLAAGRAGWRPALALTALAITALTLLTFAPNRIGLHDFYRGRLARAYLGASAPPRTRSRPVPRSTASRASPSPQPPHAHEPVPPEPPSGTEEQTGDDLPLSALRPLGRPVHLICCAANDLAPDDPIAALYRGAESAVLSPAGFSVGAEWAPWPDHMRGPSLAAAITASAAAFNSHMGMKSVTYGPAVTFLMTALGLRLGLWLPHPTRAKQKHLLERLLVGWPFYAELFGRSRARGRDVFLSDGGHFENLGLYELIRRHCRYLIASDCSHDDSIAFDDFGNLVRRVREDFGVEIEIDLAPLRPGPDGRARQAMVAGDIHYPNGDTGVLLLFKPTLVGDEPADVAQYKRRNTAFPHETTGDQFYDEAQWEAYRCLGRHAARSAFSAILAGRRLRPDEPVAPLFARARRDWLAPPPGYAERLTRFATESAALDTMLERERCATLRRQVYAELDAQRPMAGKGRLRPSPPRPRLAAARGDLSLPAAELAASLAAIRRSLRLMEEMYLTADLARHHTHPLYLGVMNYIARWACAPLVRRWWPLLKSLYAPAFTAFLEDRFSLPTLDRRRDGEPLALTGTVVRLHGGRDGFAMTCWRQERRETESVPPPGARFIGYELCLWDPAPAYRVQVAQVLVQELGSVVAWNADDFYVPPGLWGTGIGEQFLRALARRGVPECRAAYLLVRLPAPQSPTAAARKHPADETQLYRSCGFAEVEHVQGPRLVLDHAIVRLDAVRRALDATAPARARPDARWLVRRIAPP